MIRLTLEFTDNLGPEADLPALLKQFDDRLRDVVGSAAHVLVDARVLADYVAEIGDGAWATLILTFRAPASLEAALTPRCSEFLAIAEAHLADLYLTHSIVFSSRLELYPDALEIERRRRQPDRPAF